ncbi:hypothetical protein GA0061078_0526 [Bifidobacterium bohemicum]|uniref:Uncharacterized protein n=1 Tax=Bifidobacterium bohemicum DSM 22767 TaxID=1437606 RepID=A0A086ZJS2_9BIFI|nr:hypothetical protein BBOH_0244 [Bifidobacterium bohemicum DSM 22767]SCB81109.1 hypothetical protein GA0061078_0526 [Bifidobacterium bohemicum]
MRANWGVAIILPVGYGPVRKMPGEMCGRLHCRLGRRAVVAKYGFHPGESVMFHENINTPLSYALDETVNRNRVARDVP